MAKPNNDKNNLMTHRFRNPCSCRVSQSSELPSLANARPSSGNVVFGDCDWRRNVYTAGSRYDGRLMTTDDIREHVRGGCVVGAALIVRLTSYLCETYRR
jgi:hypothetical protein